MLISGHDSILQRLLSVAGDTVYASAANILARLAKGSANTKLFMNAGDTAPEWAAGLMTNYLTRDCHAASGDVSYTGVGFKPSAIIFISSVSANSISFGVWTPNYDGSWGMYGTTITGVTDNTVIQHVNSAGSAFNNAIVKSVDADGFTLTWTESTGFTATGYTLYIAFR